MDIYTLAQLESYSDELAAAVRVLGTHLRPQPPLPLSDGLLSTATTTTTSSSEEQSGGRRQQQQQQRPPPSDDDDVASAKASVLAAIDGIRTLLDDPDEFLRRLAVHTQILACLKWLSEFQILACIPRAQGEEEEDDDDDDGYEDDDDGSPDGPGEHADSDSPDNPDHTTPSLPIPDLAELAGVPEHQLRRVIRLLAASSGFLREPRPDYVAHTLLSGQFVASEALDDAAACLADVVAPLALRMAETTRAAVDSRVDPMGTMADTMDMGMGMGMDMDTDMDRASTAMHADMNANMNVNATTIQAALMATPTPTPTATPKRTRQWKAYLAHAARSHSEQRLVETVAGLRWASLGKGASIVEVGAPSMSLARSLARAYPNLHVLVQATSPAMLAAEQQQQQQQQEEEVVEETTSGRSSHSSSHSSGLGRGSHHSGSHHSGGPGPGGPGDPLPRSIHDAHPDRHDISPDHNPNNHRSSTTTSSSSSSSSSSFFSPFSSSAHPNITVFLREPGGPQPVTNAAVYILHLSPTTNTPALARAELVRHLGPLQTSGGILLVLTTQLLPEPGPSRPGRRWCRRAHPVGGSTRCGVRRGIRAEAVARARDLAMLQLALHNSEGGEMEMAELRQIVDAVADEAGGRLAVANELRSPEGLVLALVLKYRPHGE